MCNSWIHIISAPLDSVSGYTPVFRIWRCPWAEHIIPNWPWKNDTTFRSWESKENHWDPLRLGWVEATVPCPASFVVTREVEVIATNRRIVWPFSAIGTKPRRRNWLGKLKTIFRRKSGFAGVRNRSVDVSWMSAISLWVRKPYRYLLKDQQRGGDLSSFLRHWNKPFLRLVEKLSFDTFWFCLQPVSSASPASDSPRNPELPTLNALSTLIPNRERRFGVINLKVKP